MTDPRLYKLQVQYANAIYQAERFTREAAIAKALMDEIAKTEAESRFQGGDAQRDGGND